MSRKNYQKKEDYIEYRFSNNIKNDSNKLPYIDVSIPSNKIKSVFDKLRERFGETEIINEYSVYKHNDLELTVFPDGSSFCRQVIIKNLKDPKIKSNILVTYKEKHKISNDYFPCKYTYNSTLDVIDVIFTINNIKIVLSTFYENNRKLEKLKSISSLGRANKIRHSNKTWCEISVIVKCSCKINDVYDIVNYVISII